MQAQSLESQVEAPSWLDRSQYPFTLRRFHARAGQMAYVDEGSGGTFLFVHGNPSWSYLYRHLILALRKRYRCVAPDHLGFGLSEKPEDGDYSPQALARNLSEFILALDLRDITLVVHDWGGMIGMASALDFPERIARIVVFNSQFWSVKGVPMAERVSGFVGSRFGKFLCQQFNAFPRLVMPLAMGDRRKLSKAVHRQYLAPFPAPSTRLAPWRLGKAITGESDWLDRLWRYRSRLASRPVLLLWGEKDRAFGPEKLQRWEGAFANHEAHVFPEVGHFVPEEIGGDAVAFVERWLQRLASQEAKASPATG